MVIARDETAASSLSDVHAAPSFETFCAVIWLSGEYRMLPAPPVTVGHSRPASEMGLPVCTETATGRAITAASVTIELMRMLNVMGTLYLTLMYFRRLCAPTSAAKTAPVL